MIAMRIVQLVDTTMRDGEQAAGIVFSAEEKKQLTIALDHAGVKWIEAGTPAMGEEEQEVLRCLLALPLQGTLFAWNRAVKSDIQAAVNCGFSVVHISVPVSDLHIEQKLNRDRAWVLDQLREAVLFARSHGCQVSVGAEDASRADMEYFLQVADTAEKLGAMRIRFADTVGCMDPFTVAESMQRLVSRCPLPIEFHGHNDFGLGVANTWAACNAGAGYASTTVLGLGERAGNANMEQVVKVLGRFGNAKTQIALSAIDQLNTMVGHMSLRPAFSNYA
jgi:homocitrate synthase NifV